MAISHRISSSHRPRRSAAVASSFPDFCTHTGGSRMRVQEKLPLQPQSSAPIGQHAEGGRRALGLELRGAALPAFRLQRDLQPCDNCSSGPPFATIAGPHSFIDPSRSDDARGRAASHQGCGRAWFDRCDIFWTGARPSTQTGDLNAASPLLRHTSLFF